MFRRSARILIPAACSLLFAAEVCAQSPSGKGGAGSSVIPRSTFAAPQPPAECPVACAAAIADIPDDVDLVVVVENGADLRASPIGDAAARFLADSGIIVDLTKAWKALGDQMGWSTQETFDRLLGRRVVLLSKSLGQGGDRRWAILSDVNAETEQVLKEKLEAAPRAISQGHKILTVENGAYELTSHHQTTARVTAATKAVNASRRAADNARVTLVLGPTGRGELFDEMLSRLSRAADPLNPAGNKPQVAANNGPMGTISSHEVFTLACQAGPTEVLVLAALDDAIGATGAAAKQAAPADRWKDFVLLAGHRVQDAPAEVGEKPAGAMWRSRVVVRQTARREQLLKIESTSDAPFRALASGAMLATVQNAPLSDVLGAWAPLTSILSILPIPESAKNQMSSQQAICVRTVGADKRISCTFARQTGCTEQLSRTMDGDTAATLARLEKQFGVDAPPPQDYSGLAPNAVRTTPLACSAGGALSVFTSRPLTVSWAYPSQIAVNGPGNLNDPAVKCGGICAGVDAGKKRPGWWVLNISQEAAPACDIPGRSPGEILRSDANALLISALPAGPEHGDVPPKQMGRWVWLLSAQPAAIESMLPSSIPDLNGFRSGLRRFESVDLALQITEQGDVQGDVGLRLAEQPGQKK